MPLSLAATLLLVLPGAGQAATAPPPRAPAPTYQSVSQEVLITMDDGVQLAATVARPSRDGQTPAPGRFPVVLAMTPYGRNALCACTAVSYWATRGFIGAIVDVRGTGGSGGDLGGNYLSPREARDGYNLVEHFGTRDYSTGKVGMAGESYLGITQFLAAELRPPHLTVIAPTSALGDLYRDAFAHGGIVNLSFDVQYLAEQGAPGASGVNTDPSLLEATARAKLGQSAPGAIAFDYLERPNDDPFYRARSPIYRAEAIKVPALIVGRWRDGFVRGAPEMYQRLARRRGVETRLYMDPCTHKGCAEFYPSAPPTRESLGGVVFEFLDKYLRGARIPRRPKVRYYLQAHNELVDSDRWPPGGTAARRLSLGKGTSSYVTNPAAGFSLAFNKYGTVGLTPFVPVDQRAEDGQGVIFRTPVLSSPLDLVGPAAVRLKAASTATDTDWHVKLSDVGPDGTQSLITEGSLRASHRALDPSESTAIRPYHTHTNPRPIEPGRFYPYDVEIEPTGYRVARGHRLQARITSTDLPSHFPGSIYFSRSRPLEARVALNPPATNTIRLQESYLSLPAANALDGGLFPCLARRSPIGPRNIGRIRLGYTRARLDRLRVRSPRRGRRVLRYCVKRSRGRVTVVFTSRSPRARSRLVVTTSRGHGNRRVRVGSTASRFRRAYPNRVRIGRGLYRARRRSPRVFGVRRGRVRFIAVAGRHTAVRRYLRVAGVR